MTAKRSSDPNQLAKFLSGCFIRGAVLVGTAGVAATLTRLLHRVTIPGNCNADV
jgi:hypothetical protein